MGKSVKNWGNTGMAESNLRAIAYVGYGYDRLPAGQTQSIARLLTLIFPQTQKVERNFE